MRQDATRDVMDVIELGPRVFLFIEEDRRRTDDEDRLDDVRARLTNAQIDGQVRRIRNRVRKGAA